ncbi:U2 small nuclear ribonucleoprotein auxiliary factor 35 kDa subunit-related protein 2 isoform X1 [Rattus norvegicus]|uniref:Zinc finger (CCCH type), RNA binding motif and serine/arginine rich 2 n=2 Tax=Rattus norvegicus TaxID=10116 RepID=D3ZHQ8_RAT|nr:zinc finger (CCCH type), RNA binding motif and serine/arginine rich 2 [Rattus norvegicus]XP_006256949.1 U2 small nuclear ribonucleoprotein auxiliary factor 35 kDa subunit-related protein 2 [Rattus norvegicus]|eukprot:XP_006256949.1 PREDICTED: U2 small nuclear ribonucleoprotein auxiliary factor 35 kDa subunit-related protein 2 [Rattus norvegicus]
MEVVGPTAVPQKLSRKKYMALRKKEKRKKRRQELARLRDAELSQKEEEEDPLGEEKRLEEERLLEAERQRLHEEWLLREEKAQEEFRAKKRKEEAARKRKEELERKLKAEWEEQQRKEREEEEQKQQEKREREEAAQKRLDQAENELENGGTWQNPEPPTDIRVLEKDRANCPFYSKTGACRFGDRCSRKHNFPTSSPTLLIKSMFTTFGMEQCRRDDYDPDSSLEYSEEETYQQFLDFYYDVLPEFKSVGKVIQFKVSCNLEPHLRGNVYVQYQSEEDCQAAFSVFNGRWYAGRQLQCEFCPVTRWKMAICGLFEVQQCPRGKHCNFLHVFRNPNNEYREANRDIYLSPDWTSSSFAKSSERRERASHYDEYYGRSRRRRSPSPGLSYKRNGESDRKSSSNHRVKKSHKHGMKNRERHSSRSRRRKRDHSLGPWSQSRRSRHSRSRSHSQSRSRSSSRSRSCGRGRGWSHSRSHSRSRKRSRNRSRSRSRNRNRNRNRKRNQSRSWSHSHSHSRSSSRSRSPGRRRSGSRDKTTQSPKSK